MYSDNMKMYRAGNVHDNAGLGFDFTSIITPALQGGMEIAKMRLQMQMQRRAMEQQQRIAEQSAAAEAMRYAQQAAASGGRILSSVPREFLIGAAVAGAVLVYLIASPRRS